MRHNSFIDLFCVAHSGAPVTNQEEGRKASRKEKEGGGGKKKRKALSSLTKLQRDQYHTID